MGSQERIIPYNMNEFREGPPPVAPVTPPTESISPAPTSDSGGSNRRSFLGRVGAVFGIGAAGKAGEALFNPTTVSADTAPAPSAEAALQVLPPSAINIEKDQNKILEITRSLITKVNQMFPDSDSRVNATGYRISNGWHAQDGFKYLAFQRVIFQEEPSGRVNFWNTLDNMSDYGLDDKLDNGTFGVTIPPMQKFNDRSTTLDGIFEERAAVLNMPKTMADYVREIRRTAETGVFTALKDYGPYKVGRYQRGAVMEWTDGPNKGLVQGILAGDAAAAAGLIPKDVLLDKPDLGSGGGPEVVIQTMVLNIESPKKMISIYGASGESRSFSGDQNSLAALEKIISEYGVNNIQWMYDSNIPIPSLSANGFVNTSELPPGGSYINESSRAFNPVYIVLMKPEIDKASGTIKQGYRYGGDAVRLSPKRLGELNETLIPTLIAEQLLYFKYDNYNPSSPPSEFNTLSNRIGAIKPEPVTHIVA